MINDSQASLQFNDSSSVGVALPDQSLAQMSAFAALIESLELLEEANANNSSLSSLPELTRKTLLTELQTCMAHLRRKQPKHSSVRLTLARLKQDARQALDNESIVRHPGAHSGIQDKNTST